MMARDLRFDLEVGYDLFFLRLARVADILYRFHDGFWYCWLGICFNSNFKLLAYFGNFRST